MLSIPIEYEDGVVPPGGNGFKVGAFKTIDIGLLKQFCMVDTGLTLSVPSTYDVRVEPLRSYIIWGWTLQGLEHHHQGKGRLVLLVYGRPGENEPVGRVWITERNVVPIRFVEQAPTGGRLIRGDAQTTVTGD